MSKYTPLGLEDVMPFGKYKGAKLRVVLAENPGYVRWLLSNMPTFQLDKQADERLEAEEEHQIESHDAGDDLYWSNK